MKNPFKLIFILITSIIGWVSVILCTFLHMITGCIYMLFKKDWEWAHMQATFPFIHTAFLINGVRLKVKGRENIPRDHNFIIMSNHQSLADIPALIVAAKRKFYFVSKPEISKVPILNISMRIQGHKVISRTNPREANKQIAELRQVVKDGGSLLVFPEGTRSKTGKVGDFKRGSFMVATLPEVPVIPCYINGMDKVMPAKGLRAHPGIVTISFGKPLYIKPIPENADNLTEKKHVVDFMKRTKDAVLQLEKESEAPGC